MKDQFLEIDVRLLVLRYGRKRVLDALARLPDESPEELKHHLHAIEKNPKSAPTKTRKMSVIDIVDAEYRDSPDIVEPLRAIALNFNNRTFLPELRDVERFFDRIGLSPGRLKSRAAAGPMLIRALSKFPRDELLRLAQSSRVPGESDYSLLSRAIMGKPAIKPRDKE